MSDEFLDAALEDISNILLMLDRTDIDASKNPEWSEVEELLSSVAARAGQLYQELTPE